MAEDVRDQLKAAKQLVVENNKALKALSSFKGIPHRVEYIGKIKNNDSFDNLNQIKT